MAKVIEIRFEPEVSLEFTREEIGALMELSKHHYDSVCRSLSVPGPGAVIYGMTHEDSDPVTSHMLRFRDVDLMAKCCEMARPANKVGMRLWWELSQVLRRMNAEAERVNADVPAVQP